MKNITKTLALSLFVLNVLFVSCSKKEAPKFIGVQGGTTGQYFVDGSEDWGFDGIKGYHSKQYQNPGLAIQDMKNNTIKYVMTDQAPALALSKSISGIKTINIPLSSEEYAFAIDKNQPELLKKVNDALNALKENGTLDKIFEAYSTGVGITPVYSAKINHSNPEKQFVVATNAEFNPFEYREGDKFLGIDMEIASAIAKYLNLELVIEDMDFDSVVLSVGKNDVDVGMAALTVNETRKKSVNFSSSYYNAAQVLITKDSDKTFDNCKTAEDVLALIK